MAFSLEVAKTLTTKTRLDYETENFVTNHGGYFDNPTYAIQGSMVGRGDKSGPQGNGINEEVCFTMNTVDRHAVAHVFKFRGGCEGGNQVEPFYDIAPCQTKMDQHIAVAFSSECANSLGANDYKEPQAVLYDMAVRRLTPIECERLQGFPDNWTKINAKTPDTARYKALGNSMAVPVMHWIGKQIDRVTPKNTLQ